MGKIALAILVVGLCFYNGYLKINKLDGDGLAALIAIIASIILLVNWKE